MGEGNPTISRETETQVLAACQPQPRQPHIIKLISQLQNPTRKISDTWIIDTGKRETRYQLVKIHQTIRQPHKKNKIKTDFVLSLACSKSFRWCHCCDYYSVSVINRNNDGTWRTIPQIQLLKAISIYLISRVYIWHLFNWYKNQFRDFPDGPAFPLQGSVPDWRTKVLRAVWPKNKNTNNNRKEL